MDDCDIVVFICICDGNGHVSVVVLGSVDDCDFDCGELIGDKVGEIVGDSGIGVDRESCDDCGADYGVADESCGLVDYDEFELILLLES